MREYITPNWHAVLVHAPLGLLSVGILIEVFSFLWRRSSVRMAGRWMILLGAVTSVPALTSGMYAYRDALSPVMNVSEVHFDDSWRDLLDSKLVDRASVTAGKEAKQITAGEMLAGDAGKALWNHLIYNCIGVGIIFLAIIAFIGCSDLWRRRMYFPLLLILIAGETALIWGSHSGGILVYEHAVAMKPATPPSTVKPTRDEMLRAGLPPAQLHMTLAGYIVGIALVALGLSIRAITEGAPTLATEETWFEGEQAGAHSGTNPARARSSGVIATGESTLVTENPVETVPLGDPAPPVRGEIVRPVVIAPVTPVIPIATSRFWLLSTLTTLATFVSGLWIVNAWSWPHLQEIIRNENRNMYHTVLGTSIIVLTLILALVTRVARRGKAVISIFALLLFVAIGLQIWIGAMLTFDGPKWKPATKGAKVGLVDPFRLNPAGD